jgi:hypothetical protein
MSSRDLRVSVFQSKSSCGAFSGADSCVAGWYSTHMQLKKSSYADGAFAYPFLSHDHLSRGATVATISVRCGTSAIMISICLDLALLCHPVLAFITIQRPKMAVEQSKWQYFFLSFFALLAMRYASTTNATPQVLQDIVPAVCQTVDQPNPIASLYPMNATGTLNGTVSVLPISLELARQLIPSQYRILEHAYRHLLPTFPEGMYPAILQAVHDHGVQAFGFQIPDFSVRDASKPQSRSC